MNKNTLNMDIYSTMNNKNKQDILRMVFWL